MTSTDTLRLSRADYAALAQRALDGHATSDDLAILRDHPVEWEEALVALHERAVSDLQDLRQRVRGPERALVLEDFDALVAEIDAAHVELTGRSLAPPPPEDVDEEDDSSELEEDPWLGVSQLQLSWSRDRLVAWVGGNEADTGDHDRIRAALDAAGASSKAWEVAEPVSLPHGVQADALSAPLSSTLGWLVTVGHTHDDEGVGASVTWLGLAAGLALRLVAQGRMVPQLQRLQSDNSGKRSPFAVRWSPTLIDHEEMSDLVKSVPGVVAILERQRDPRAVTKNVVGGFVDAICREAAARVEVPAPPPQPRSASEVGEAVLARLDGSVLEAPTGYGTEISKGLQTWASGVTGAPRLGLVVRLDEPDEDGAWHLRTFASDGRAKEEPVEAAMSRAKHKRKESIKHELERLEELYEPLMRGRSQRRGEVVLAQEEAWDLMAHAGSVLSAAGFDVQVPDLAPKKARPTLKVTSNEGGEQKDTNVGAQQLTAVSWSAVFDDVELTASDIERLARESRPLVKSGGRWVEVDHADLEAAAEALAEREATTQLSGADMLRYALGLDGVALGSAVQVGGDGWAVDLLRAASSIPDHPPTTPPGFTGELRAYQANALAWLDFLDGAGLGGCLALDMGLGKTPTLLAHLRQTRDRGPALVIAPPAVVGNWAAESHRFVPELKVLVHHGQNRAELDEIAAAVDGHDVVITTYGTSVRDIEALSALGWGKVVLDEAQVIKNTSSETAQQLRRLQAHNRVVLTGTPIENGLGDLWSLMDFVNPGLVGERATFIAQMTEANEAGERAESALKTLNGVLVFRRTKAEPVIAAELPDRIDHLDQCAMTSEQIGLYQAVLDQLVAETADDGTPKKKGAVLAAITALKQICNHPASYTGDDGPLAGRSGKLARLEELVDNVFEAGERMLIFTHFATWGERLADHLTERTGRTVHCYHGGLGRTARDRMVEEFQALTGPGAMVLSLKAGGTGLNLTAASHVVLYDRWWNPAVEDQARDRVWRIGQERTVVCHRLVCPGTVDERVEEVVAGKRRIADMTLPKSSSISDLDSEQLQRALGLDPDLMIDTEDEE